MDVTHGASATAAIPAAEARAEAAAAAASPWQEQLVAQREVLNSRVAAARSAGAPVDALRAALVEMAPAADHLARSTADPDAFARSVLPLVDAVVRLVARRAWHESSAERWAMLGVVPFVPRAVSRSPETTIDVVVQGAARTVRGADLGAWGRRLAAADGHLADDESFRRAAAVAAWRSGFVRVRQAALEAAERLPDAALPLLLDLPAPTVPGHGELATGPRQVLEGNTVDPFWWPGSPTSGPLARAGGFRGSGGPWVGVPQVVGRHQALTPTWQVRADDQAWVVVADVHGTAVLRDHVARADETAEAAGTSGAARTDAAAGSKVSGRDVATDALPPQLLAAVSRHLGSDDRLTGVSPSRPLAAARGTLTVLVSQQTSYRLELVRLDLGSRDLW
jgi:hypothetical protein